MSAGVSDQRMKGQSNQVISSSSKNVESEERTSIPWSQQVDEAYETTLASPTEGNSGCCETSSGGTQFQYPPFNVKESGWSGKSSRRTSSNNYINDGIYGQSYGQQQNQQAYNYFTKNNGDYNSWNSNQVNSQHSRRTHYDDCRSDGGSHQNDSIKSVQRGMQNMGLEGNTSRSMGDTNSSGMSNAKKDTQVASVPKKMTWASIASQPAKPTLRTSSSSSTLKKKGPGMPPPPMVPGKHNMDIGTWDSPKNGPVLVPPPPPPVIPVPIMEPFNLGQTKSNSGSTNIGQSSSKEEHNLSTAPQQHHHPQQQQQHHQKSLGPNNNQSQNINQSSASSMNSNQHVRPPWISQNNPSASNTKNIHQQSQHSRSNSNQGHSSAGPGNQSNTGYHHGQSMISHQHQQSQQNHPQHQQQHQPPVPVQLPHSRPLPATSPTLSNSSSNYPVLDELRDKNNYNPPEIDMEKAAVARFFIIKSYSEDDIHRSIKYEIWCSTEHGNKRLDEAFRERQSEGGVVYLFFSVNGSRHFCGMAQMMTPVDYNSVASVWSQDKWKGKFKVKWVYVKDVPNLELRHIRLENNDNKSVTNSRDTQEVPNVRGQEVLMIIHAFKHETSIFDDFYHYEKRQEEEVSKKYEPPHLRQQNSIEGNPNTPAPLKPLRGEAGGGGGSVGSAGSGGRGGGGGTGPTGGIGSADFDRNYDNRYHDRGNGGGAGSAPGSGGYRNFNRGGGFQNFDNRRNDDHRGFDRMARDKDNQDQPGHFNHNRENNGDFHNNRGFHRGDYNRRDDRVYNNRDRDQYHDGNSGGFMRNDNNRGTGGFRDNFNRERDHFSRGRGRGGGPHRN